MPQSTLDIYSGGARASQSPYSMGAGGGIVGPGQGMFDFKGMLAQQMAMKQQLQQAQLDAMRQQMAQAKQRAKMDMYYRQQASRERGEAKKKKPFSLGVDPISKRIADFKQAAVGIGSIGQSQMGSPSIIEGTAGQRGMASPYLMELAGMPMGTGDTKAGDMPMDDPQLMSPTKARAKGLLGPQSRGFSGSFPNVTDPDFGYGGVQPYDPSWQDPSSSSFMGPPSYEKGGRVPETGTYKLHAGEVVVPKGASDVMFPYAQPGGPPKSRGSAQGSYQQGSGAVDPSYPQQFGRALGYGAGQVGQAIGAGIGAIGQIGSEFAGGFGRGLGVEEPPVGPMAPGDAVAPLGETPPDEEPAPPTGVPAYELSGSPETDRKRLERLRDEAHKADQNADYHDAKLQTIMSYASGDPSRWTPAMKKLIGQRQAVAKQYRGREAEYNKRAEALETKLIDKETVVEATSIEAGGRQQAASQTLRAKAQVDTQDKIQGLFGRVAGLLQKYGNIDDDALRASISAEISPMLFPALMAGAQGATQEEKLAWSQGIIAKLVDDFESSPEDALGTIRQILMSGYEG